MPATGRRSREGYPPLLATVSGRRSWAGAVFKESFCDSARPATACCGGVRSSSAGMFGDMQSGLCGEAAAGSPRSEAEGRSIPEEDDRTPVQAAHVCRICGFELTIKTNKRSQTIAKSIFSVRRAREIFVIAPLQDGVLCPSRSSIRIGPAARWRSVSTKRSPAAISGRLWRRPGAAVSTSAPAPPAAPGSSTGLRRCPPRSRARCSNRRRAGAGCPRRGRRRSSVA